MAGAQRLGVPLSCAAFQGRRCSRVVANWPPAIKPKFGIRVRAKDLARRSRNQMARAKGAKHAKKKTELWFDLPWRPSRPWRESFFSVRRFSRTVGKSFLLGEGVWLREKKSSQNCANMRDSSAKHAKRRTCTNWDPHPRGETGVWPSLGCRRHRFCLASSAWVNGLITPGQRPSHTVA